MRVPGSLLRWQAVLPATAEGADGTGAPEEGLPCMRRRLQMAVLMPEPGELGKVIWQDEQINLYSSLYLQT